MGKTRTMFQIKSRIHMQNVTDVISFNGGGTITSHRQRPLVAIVNGGVLGLYTLQIFWRDNPGVEHLTIIKHTNEERLAQWATTLQRQREIFTRPDGSNGSRAGKAFRAAAVLESVWMANDQRRRSEDEYSEDDDTDDDDAAALVGHPAGGFGMPKNGPDTSPRSRAATDEGSHQPHALVGNLPGTHSRGPPRHTQTGFSQPLLALVAGVGPMLSQSPRPNASYFSPVTEKQMASHTPSGQFPLPRQPSYDHNSVSRYGNTPVMAGPTPRDGAAAAAIQTVKIRFHRLQGPSLPDTTPSNLLLLQQQNQMRLANGPNIHNAPGRAQLAPSPNEMVPPVPPVPPGYVGNTGGPVVINRSQNNSPNILMQGPPVRNGLPAAQEIAPWINGGMNGTSKFQAQVTLKINLGNDKLVIIVPYNVAYTQLMDWIERKVKTRGSRPGAPSPPNIRIRYLDEDGDYIRVSSDDDLRMAFDTSGASGQNDSAGITGVVSLFVSV